MIPLHHAAANSLLYDYDLSYLVEQFPESVQVRDKRGRLPLHHISTDTPLEAVEFLVERFPESLAVQDDDGHLPLHRAAFCCDQYGVEIVQYLVVRSPQSARVKAKDGSLPLHLAIQPVAWDKGDVWLPVYGYGKNGSEQEEIDCLIQAWPESLQEKNSNGLTPLLLAANIDSSLDFIYDLATQDLEAFRRCSVATDTPTVGT